MRGLNLFVWQALEGAFAGLAGASAAKIPDMALACAADLSESDVRQSGKHAGISERHDESAHSLP